MSKDKRSVKAYINDIKWAIDDIMSFVSGMSYEEFCKDKKTIYAVIRCLEIIGKASKHVPKEIRNKYPQIPWSQMAGMRDILIHGYFGIDMGLVWDTVINDIPKLKEDIQNMRD